MKATAKKKLASTAIVSFIYFELCLFCVTRIFSAGNREKLEKKKQCLPRLVSLARRRLVRPDATAPLISFAGLTRLPGGPIDSQILPFCI